MRNYRSIISNNEAVNFTIYYSKRQDLGRFTQTDSHEFQVHGKDASTTLPFNEFNVKVVVTPGYAPDFYDYTLTVEDKGSATGGYPATPGSQVK